MSLEDDRVICLPVLYGQIRSFDCFLILSIESHSKNPFQIS